MIQLLKQKKHRKAKGWKMKKIISSLRRSANRGFTLVEMVVSIALLAILLGGMMLVIAPIVNSFNDTKTDLTAENVSTCVNEYISRSVRYASKAVVFTDTNYDEITANDTYKNLIKTLNEDAKKGGVNANYELKCISLKHQADGKWYLYEEIVDKNNGGAITSSRPIFSNVLYDGLYITADIEKPLKLVEEVPEGTGDAGTAEATTEDTAEADDPDEDERMNDTLAMTIRTYSDEGRKNLVFAGTGYIELRQIDFMLSHGGSKKDYFLEWYDVTPTDPGVTDGSDDIYIYYVVRRRGTPIV